MAQREMEVGPERPRRPLSIGAGAVVVHEGRVLLVRNVRGVTKGRYLLPAGRVDANELPDDAAVREAFEETNLRIEIEGLFGVRLWVMDDGEQNYFFMFRAKLRSPVTELRPNLGEVDDARFFSLAEMTALGPDETWSGAIAIARKALDASSTGGVWPNDAADLALSRRPCATGPGAHDRAKSLGAEADFPEILVAWRRSVACIAARRQLLKGLD
jgi:ADP-ribose pyrophosphatase YjhB (NUDIX family)